MSPIFRIFIIYPCFLFILLWLAVSPLAAGEVDSGMLQKFTDDLISGESLEYALYGVRPIVRIPKATGDEMLRRATSGEFPQDDLFKHTSFIYGSYWQNCRAYYIAYRVTGDQRFAWQLRQYAELMAWVLYERPWLILEKEERANVKSGKWQDLVPRSAATASIFQGFTLSARLTLQMARADRSLVSDEQIAEARSNLTEIVLPYMDSLVAGEDGADSNALPMPALDMIRTTPFNQSFMAYGVLVTTAAALKDLQHIDGGKGHQGTIDLYTRIVRKGIEAFVEKSDVTEIEGRPYVFMSYTPQDPLVSVLDKETRKRYPLVVDGHPVFRYPEDFAHSQSAAWYLALLWSMGREFGVDENLLSGLANSYVDYLLRGEAPLDNGTNGPPARFVSPWALIGLPDKKWKRLGRPSLVYLIYRSFNPDVIPALTELNGRSRKEMSGEQARQFILYSHYISALRQDRGLLHLSQ